MTTRMEGEWLFDPQRDDGPLTNTLVFAPLLLTATGRFTRLLVPVKGLGAQTAFSLRPARIGSLLTVAGAGLLIVFGLLALVTAVLGFAA